MIGHTRAIAGLATIAAAVTAGNDDQRRSAAAEYAWDAVQQ